MNLNFKVGMDTTSFNAGLKRMRAGFNNWAKSAASGVGGQIAGAMALERVVSSVGGLYEEAARIQKESAQLGMSTTEFQALAYAARIAGVDIEDLRDAINDLNTRQYEAIEGSKNFIDIFRRYGIHFGDVPQIRQPLELFQEFAQGMRQSMYDVSQKTFDLDELMSDNGKRMAAAINNGFAENLDLSVAAFTPEQISEYAGARRKYIETSEQGKTMAIQALDWLSDIAGGVGGSIFGTLRPQALDDEYLRAQLEIELAMKQSRNYLRDISKGFTQ